MDQENPLNTAEYFIGKVIIDDEKGAVAHLHVRDVIMKTPWTVTIPVTLLAVPKHPCFVVCDGDTKHVVRSRISLPRGF